MNINIWIKILAISVNWPIYCAYHYIDSNIGNYGGFGCLNCWKLCVELTICVCKLLSAESTYDLVDRWPFCVGSDAVIFPLTVRFFSISTPLLAIKDSSFKFVHICSRSSHIFLFLFLTATDNIQAKNPSFKNEFARFSRKFVKDGCE